MHDACIYLTFGSGVGEAAYLEGRFKETFSLLLPNARDSRTNHSSAFSLQFVPVPENISDF